MGFAAEMRDFVQGFRVGRSMIRDKTKEELEEERLKKAMEKGSSDAEAAGRDRSQSRTFTRSRASTGSVIPDDGQGGNATHEGYTGGGDATGYDSPRERAGFSPKSDEPGGGVAGLTDNAIQSVDTTGDQALLALLRKDSGEHAYGAMTYKKDGSPGGRANFEGMTLAQVFDHQNWMKENGYASTAVGAYQTIAGTLRGAVNEMGLPLDTRFDKTTQDRIALHLANKRGYADFKAGKIDADTFATNLAKEWAILPKDASGAGFYDGFNQNKAGVGWGQVIATLDKAKGGSKAPASPVQTPQVAGTTPATSPVTSGGNEPDLAERSRAAELEARKRGLVPGTPEYIDFVLKPGQEDEARRRAAPPQRTAAIPEPVDAEQTENVQAYAAGGAVQANAQAELKPGVNAPWPGEPIRGGVPAHPSSFNFRGAPQTMVGNNVSPNGFVQGTGQFDVDMLRANNGAWGFQGNGHDTQQDMRQGPLPPMNVPYWDRPYDELPGYNGGYYAGAPVHETNNPAPGPQMRRTALSDRLDRARHSDPMPPPAPRTGGDAPAPATAAPAAPAPVARAAATPAPPVTAGGNAPAAAPPVAQAAVTAIPETPGETRWADEFRERRRESQQRSMDAQSRYLLDQERAASTFDADAYLRHNPDLKMSPHEAHQHYNQIGKDEGRVWWERDRQVMPPSTLPETATTEERIADLKARREQSKQRLQNPVYVADAPERQLVRTQPYGSFTRGSSGPPYQQAITGWNDKGMPVIEEETGNIWDGYYGNADYDQGWTRDVRRFADGGVVEEEEAPRGAVPETPMPPPRPHREMALHPQERRNAAQPASAPSGEDPHSSNPAVDFNVRELARVDPDAIRGGMRAISEVFGFNSRPQAGIGPGSDGARLEAFARNEGGFTTEEVRAAKQTVDPGKSLSEGERTLAALHAGYRFYEDKGDFRKADAFAARMLIHIKKVVATGGVMAQAALENGDVPRAAKVMQEAYDYVPDGSKLEVLNADRSGVQFRLIDENGDVTKEGRATIDQMMYMATGMQNGTEWFRAAGAIASKSNRDRVADARLKIAQDREDRNYERGERQYERQQRLDERREKQDSENQRRWETEHNLRVEELKRRQDRDEEARLKNEATANEQARMAEGYDEIQAQLDEAQEALGRAGNLGEKMDAEKALAAAQAEARKWVEGHPKRMQQFGSALGLRPTRGGRAGAGTSGGNRTAIPESPAVDGAPSGAGPARNQTAAQKEAAGVDMQTRADLNRLGQSNTIPPVPSKSDPQGAIPVDEEGGPWVTQGDGVQPGTAQTKAFDIVAGGEFRKNADEPPGYTERDAINQNISSEIAKAYQAENKDPSKIAPPLMSALTRTVQDIVRGNNIDTPEAIRIMRKAYDPTVPIGRVAGGMYKFGDNPPIRLSPEGLESIMTMRARARAALDKAAQAGTGGANTTTAPKTAIPDVSEPDPAIVRQAEERNARALQQEQESLSNTRAEKTREREKLMEGISPEKYAAAVKRNGGKELTLKQVRQLRDSLYEDLPRESLTAPAPFLPRKRVD